MQVYLGIGEADGQPGKVMALAYTGDPGEGIIAILSTAFLDSEAEAYAWFAEQEQTQPWVTRQ